MRCIDNCEKNKMGHHVGTNNFALVHAKDKILFKFFRLYWLT